MRPSLLLLLAAGALALPVSATAQTSPDYVEVIAIPQPPALSFLGMRMESANGGPLLITELHPESPAVVAGLEVGDSIVAVDGRSIVDHPINWRRLEVGRAYRLTVVTAGREREVTLVPAPPRTRPASR